MKKSHSIKPARARLGLTGAILCVCIGFGMGHAGGLDMPVQPTALAADKRETAATGGPAFQEVRADIQRPAVLRIDGAVTYQDGGPIHVDMTTLQTLEPHTISTSTVVTDGVMTFDGVLMRAVLDHVGAHGTIVTASALNGYEVDIPIQDFQDFDVLLAWSMNGVRLKEDDKGPFWIVYPRDHHETLQDIRYDYRWVWQLVSLRVN